MNKEEVMGDWCAVHTLRKSYPYTCVGRNDVNKLKQDIRRRMIGRLLALAFFIGCRLCKLVRIRLGLTEHQFYEQYPAGWWLVIAMGSGFIISLAYAAKKSLDIHPNIQLRSKPDEALKEVLTDPEYGPWHPEAQRMLDERRSSSTFRRRWPFAFLGVLLIVFLASLDFTIRGRYEGLRPRNAGFASLVGLLLYMAAGLFVFLSSRDRIKRIRLRRSRIPLSAAMYSCFFLWLLGAIAWIVYIFDF